MWGFGYRYVRNEYDESWLVAHFGRIRHHGFKSCGHDWPKPCARDGQMQQSWCRIAQFGKDSAFGLVMYHKPKIYPKFFCIVWDVEAF